MRRWMTALATLSTIACGSEPEASPPAQTPPAAQAPAPAARRPSFPTAEQFRFGDDVALRGGASARCQKLYLGDTVVALVETWIHTGNGAAVRRCEGTGWAAPASPTAAELAGVGAQLDGRLAPDFDGLGVDMDGALTFTPLGLTGRITELAFAGRWAAYATAGPPQDAGGAREVEVIGVIYDLPNRFPVQEFLLGTCRLQGSDPLRLQPATWSSDGRAVVYHGIAQSCSFGNVEVHPE